jgi:xanthosine utilization system XapX-like protein
MSRILGRGRYATETYPSTPSSFGSGGLVWRPDGLGDVRTWAEVMAVVSALKAPLTVYVPQPSPAYSIPAGNYDTKYLNFEAPRNPNAIVTVQIEDGALLRNLSGIGGAMILRGASNATCLAYDGDFGFLRLHELARISNSTVTPMLQLTAGKTLAIYFEELAAADGPVVNATGGILGILVSEQALEITDNFATGAAPATVAYIHDGSIAFPALAGFGNTINLPMGQDGGYGPLGFRPQGLFQPVKTGCAYWDTSLLPAPGKMIWYNGTVWVDATGTPV